MADTNRINDLAEHVRGQLADGLIPIRFAVTESGEHHSCEVAVIGGTDRAVSSAFEFRPAQRSPVGEFNVVLLVPTGVGAEIGGHAGDVAPVATLLAELSDTLITHPNVVNASDINEMPRNGLYVEGSVITRLLMGTVGLRPVRSNRVLVVIDDHKDPLFVNAAINAVNAARATYGLSCPSVVQLDPPVRLRARFSSSGRAAGRVENLAALCDVLDERRDEYDAVALSSVIDVPHEYHSEYFEQSGDMVNPWGGVEAMLTHAISLMFDVPSAHSPMFESRAIANMDPGVVDPRMAAEAISLTFLQCILKGLHKSPKIVTDTDAMNQSGVLTAGDVSCLVIPDGCLGLPTLAALEQGISVIAVRENRNLMRNDLSALPWRPGQFRVVENYWEAAGVLAAMRAGIAPESVRRPMTFVPVEVVSKRKKDDCPAPQHQQPRVD